MQEAVERDQRQIDLELLQRVLSGDGDGWTGFCRRFDGFIARCVSRVLHRYGVRLAAEDVDDLVAEVWVALLRDDCAKLRRFDPERGTRLSSWVGLIATNTTIDYLRVNHTVVAYIDDTPHAEPVETARPDMRYDQVQRAEIARQAISRLREDEQRFVRYCFSDELCTKRIAEELGISINTVHSRKFKLRKKITRIVERIQTRAQA
ncbi:MAG: sigma-70 family RNA polymerase sigma factor [Deltaproteobacteria bacterium]|nr:sigma-70 family RNA polymerase sigma factor [Deltaproteobacteria bacterium]